MTQPSTHRANEAARTAHACDKKEIDINGYWYYPDTPISKVGVFPYRGSQIPGSPDPDAIYGVLRSPEELGSEQAIESFKNIPWVDDHAMLGSEDFGLMPAEKKGIHGVNGANVYFKDGTLYGDVKVWSEALKTRIANDKRELSLGYRCKYEPAQGVFDGQPYQYIQREIRGNHLALVDKGRMGADVAVTDAADCFVFTCDSQLEEFIMAEPSNTPAAGGEPSSGVSLEQVIAQLNQLIAAVAELKKAQGGDPAADPASDPAAATKDANPNPASEGGEGNVLEEILDLIQNIDERLKKVEGGTATGDEDPKADDPKIDEKKAAEAMDAAIKEGVQKRLREAQTDLAAKSALASHLSEVIGTFDHAAMLTPSEVAAYGCKKLGLAVSAGQEVAAINGYLARKPETKSATAQDSAPKADWLADQLNK